MLYIPLNQGYNGSMKAIKSLKEFKSKVIPLIRAGAYEFEYRPDSDTKQYPLTAEEREQLIIATTGRDFKVEDYQVPPTYICTPRKVLVDYPEVSRWYIKLYFDGPKLIMFISLHPDGA